MKILRLNTCFVLPNNFDGGVNEAIEELIKYRKNKALNQFTKNDEPAKDWNEMSFIEQWNYLNESVQKGFCHVGSADLIEFDETTGKIIEPNQ